MTFPVLGGNGAVGGFSIDNSLRFNRDIDNASLTRTPSSASNRKTWTFSAWVKRCIGAGGDVVLGYSSSANDYGALYFHNNPNDGLLRIYDIQGGNFVFNLSSNHTLRDVSAWYHFVISADTTQATASNRLKMYINGVQVTSFATATYPSQNADLLVNNNCLHAIGRYADVNTGHIHGYMADVYLIDGQQLSPTDFGEFDEDSGIWKPKEYEGTYGTNGFKLNFSNSGSLGADQSGNGNNFTPTNLASTDQTTDTPTNNFATFNALFKRASVNPTFSEGNLKVVQGASNGIAYSTQGVSSGKWYVEIKVDNVGTGTRCGILEPSAYDNGNPDTQALYYQENGTKNNKGSASSYGASYTTGDIIGIALDADNGTLAFYKNGVSQGTAFTGLDTNTTWLIGCHGYGSSSSQSGNYGNPPFAISSGNSDDNGYGNFEYAPPSGYLALCTQNLATELSPTIDDGSQYFNTVTYTGNGSNGLAITGVGFQPDWTWIKNRSRTVTHILTDSSRGTNKQLHSNLNNAEQTYTDFIASFDTDGFTVNDSANGQGDVNYFSGNSYVGWNWLANGGTTSSNTDGSITSTVQANTTAGFSIVTYTGTGSNATIGHGLGKVPAMMIVKKRSGADDWAVYHNGVLTPSDARYHYVQLNTTNAYAGDGTYWNDTAPTTSVFTVGTNADVNTSGATYVAYIFTDIEGYSKFDSYEGNGSTDGAFVYTGFRPSFILMKNIDATENWLIYDNKRDPHNVTDEALLPNSSSASGGSANAMDLLSNGFKFRSSAGSLNGSNKTFIYMAFAENPFVSSSGVPVTAR